jgi:acetaldehyde dehydrogenase / alcohol dehydrogenase
VCASEHNLVVDRAVVTGFAAALERHGARVVQPDEVDRVVEAVFDPVDQHVRSDLLGQSAARLASAAALVDAEMVRLIVVPAPLDRINGPLGYEKLAPIVSLFVVDDEDQGLRVCRQILANEGAGHTAIIHSSDQARIDRFSFEMPASRILVNVPGAQGTLGMCTGLVPSMTLGSGTFGRTSTTDSITYTHLLNIKRVAYALAA